MGSGTRKMGIEKREKIAGLLLVSPWIVGFLLFGLFPMGVSGYLTFVKWDFLRDPQWVGLSNFQEVFRNPIFYTALKNTLIITFGSSLIYLVFGVIIAAMLAKDYLGSNVFRAIIFLPSLVIGTALAMMMQPVFGNGKYGLLNQVLNLLGLPYQSWLTEPGQAVWVIVAMSFWFLGSGVIIYLAGIKGIDPSYFEAAMIDGANGLQQFYKVTIPLLTPVLLFQSIMGIIGGLQVFDLALTLASEFKTGGMGNENSLATLVFYLYTLAFRDYNMGSAAVVGWVIFIVSLLLSLVIFRLSKKFQLFGEEESK
ncbi:carbohydrate ABC transporter permease [Cohnella phaseoli]|uniref:Multiple sugar transport system permease protein n=1 Tax=Cohnella phaseoli TaxID=456490 RepID=A0A3D9JQS0_9BACL|nr:sugar ABC transporter permease [Cohnella phaseoli]RED75786.1 multiple sugar transport system permease protein [Cohnella phaseoli]